MIRLTEHAEEALETRGISLSWVEFTVRAPNRVWIDPARPDRLHAYKAISAFVIRVLHVVHRPDGPDVFDRSAKL